jgi:phenylalanyl-tRNA synthetase beta chain
MKFTYNWLKDFVGIRLAPAKLADKLTMAGLEVGSVTPAGDDFVFEVEITSNRPDWLSVVGIAREAAALTGKKIKTPAVPKAKYRITPGATSKETFRIRIEDKKDCPVYTARIIRDVRVGPSPQWLKEKLEAIGCRSINNVVDATNYIMFAWGQPLHAFDLDKLNTDTIVVRRAKAGEKLVLIDGQEKALTGDVLVIADTHKPVAVAGIMGGKDTEVGEGTTRILLEAAIFNPLVVRVGKRMLGLQSDSAYRFERSVDIAGVEYASFLAAELIHDLAAGRCAASVSSSLPVVKPRRVALSLAAVRKLTGAEDISASQTEKILHALGFNVKTKAKNDFLVEVPSFRPDVSIEADLIEEVARIFGYEHIPTTLPPIIPRAGTPGSHELVAQLKNILTGLGLNEVITHSLIPRDLLKGFHPDNAQTLEILNPLSKEQEVLRPTLLPSLARCVSRNLNQKQDYVAIFEIASIFCGPASSLKEELSLGVALCGKRSLWLGQGAVQDAPGFLHLKGILQTVFERLGIGSQEYAFACAGQPDVIEAHVCGVRVGAMIKLRGETLERYDIKNKDVFEAQINLARFFPLARPEKNFTPWPVYPEILRDISLVLKEEIPVAQVKETIRALAGKFLEAVEITDYYKGRQIEPGFKGLTVSCRYRSQERTLTDTEINALHAKVVQGLTDTQGVRIR